MLKPRPSQQQGIEIASTHPGFSFLWEMGAGKTLLMLLNELRDPGKTLVTAPKTVIGSAWAKQAEEAGVEFIDATGISPAKRKKIYSTNSKVMIGINHELLLRDKDIIIQSDFDRFNIDEASKLRNHESKTTISAIEIADACDEKYCLTGSPFPNSPVESWSLLRATSVKHSTPDFYRFANHFFFPVKQWRTIKKKTRFGVRTFRKQVIIGWEFKSPQHRDVFVQHLSQVMWALRKKDILDLPPVVQEIYQVELSKAEREAYENLRQDLKMSIPGLTREALREVSVKENGREMKLRQLCAGMVKVDEHRILDFGRSSKLEALRDILTELEGTTVLIWAEFRHEIDAISAVARELNRSVGILDGRTKSAQAIIDLTIDGQLDTVVAHPKSAGHGVDGLQKASAHMIFFSLSYSSDNFKQAIGRLDRGGQTGVDAVTVIILQAVDTIDERLYDVVTEKSSAEDALLDELRR